MYYNFNLVTHPLIQHKLTFIRDKNTTKKEFKELVNEVASLMLYEITEDLPMEMIEIETPIKKMKSPVITGKKLAFVPVLRAGMGMIEGLMNLIPSARVGHIGIFRNESTLEPVNYYLKLPKDAAQRDIILIDPMLATGGTAVEAVNILKANGCKSIKFLCLVAAPEGVKKFCDAHADVDVYAAALDEGLNERGYIVPGLGDAGDRLFGTE